jgi:hypothetical protein
LGIVFLLMFLPGGLGELVFRGRDWALRWIAARRGMLVPSLVADARAEEEQVASQPTALESRTLDSGTLESEILEGAGR